MERRKNTILLISPDLDLGRRRKALLESEGLPVVVIRSSREVGKACEQHRPRLIMIGYSADPAERRHVWAAAREICKTTIVELGPTGIPEMTQTSFFLDPDPPSDFVRRIKQIMNVRA